MEDIRKYIDDPLFVKWVYEPDENLEEYWNIYFESHPEEKAYVLKLKDELLHFRISNQKIQGERKKALALHISHDIQKKKKRSTLLRTAQNTFKYAAFAVLFMGVGASLFYIFQKKSDLSNYSRYLEIPQISDKPLLVLSDGSNVNLNKKESTVNYASQNGIVVNEDTIIAVKGNKKKDEKTLNQLIIPYGNRSRVVLSDQSVVWLNAGSRLIYPSEFEGKEREVLLFGEAFFEIQKDENKPFIVVTSDYRIKVLGTKFNVSAYPGDVVSQTVLSEGSIELSMNNESWFDKGMVLKPNEMFSFNKNSNQTVIKKIEPEKYILWKEGILKFDNEDLSRVIKKIERFYNISIKLNDPLDGDINIDGKLDLNEDKYQVLHYVSKVARREYIELDKSHFLIK